MRRFEEYPKAVSEFLANVLIEIVMFPLTLAKAIFVKVVDFFEKLDNF